MTSTIHITPLHTTLPSFPTLPPKPRVSRSPYPISQKTTAPVTPARKAYRRLKSMLSSIKPPTKTYTSTAQETAAAYDAYDKGHATSTQAQRRKVQAPTDVPGGQLAPGHPSASGQPLQASTSVDGFYGWAQVAKTSARFISVLLDCPETLPSTDPSEVNPDLAHFIAFALSRSRMPLCVHQYALHLVRRVKCLNPEFKPKHAHGTYLTALMLAAKHSHDGVYSLNDWAAIGQDIFEPLQLRENEWRMCERLEWRFLVHPMDLVKLAWTIELEYGELDEGAPSSGDIDHSDSELGLSGMFATSVASSLSSLSTSSSGCSLSSPWSGWGEATPSDSSISTPGSNVPISCSSSPSPFVLA